MPSIAIAVIAVIVALAIAIPVTAKIATSKYQKDVESKLGNADDKARQIIDDALKTAEAKKRESLLEVRKSPSVQRTNWTKRSRIAELRYSVMNAASSRRKRTSIRNPMRSRRRKQALLPEKKNWQSRKKKLPA